MINNPLKYTDPTGHAQSCEDGDVCRSPNTTTSPALGNGRNHHRHQHHDDPDPINDPVFGGGGGKPLFAPEPTAKDDAVKWCQLEDCLLAGVGVLATALTLVPDPPVADFAFGVDVVVTVWAGLRTEDDFSHGRISQTRRLLLDGTGFVGLAPTTFGLGVSVTNFLMTLTGLPN